MNFFAHRRYNDLKARRKMSVTQRRKFLVELYLRGRENKIMFYIKF